MGIYYTLIILLIIFSILYTYDTKPINIIIDYIGMILTLSIILININLIDISLISYILIIIYASALAILFGFIIMLYNTNINNKRLGIKRNNIIKIIKNNPIILKDYILPIKLIFMNKYNNINYIIFILIFLYISFMIYKFFLYYTFHFQYIDSFYLSYSSFKTIFIYFSYLFNDFNDLNNIILILIILLLALLGVIYILI